jgi:peptide deformylase
MLRPIVRYGRPELQTPARPVTKFDAELDRLIDDMVDTMREYNGVGLAAPQVHEGVRLFVALLADDPDEGTSAVVIVNPEIVSNTSARQEGWEGCLSIPDIRGLVPRFTDITVKALDRDGRPIELRLRDFPARVVQHETDHLDGVLFFDRMTSMQSLTYLEEYSRYHADDKD